MTDGAIAGHVPYRSRLLSYSVAAVILPAVKQAGCRLALEPGRCIVGNSGVLISRVIYVKRESGKRFVIQDGAMNDLVRPAMYDSFHAIWPVASDEQELPDVDNSSRGP